MFYCSDFNSLSVLSLFEGEMLGKVDKLYFDKKLKKLCEVELVGEDGAKLILPTKNIYHVGKNAITVKNNQAVKFKRAEQESCPAPISSKVYSITGEFLGVVQEMQFDEKFLTQKIALDNGEVLDLKNLASCGRNTVIFYNNDTKININNFMPDKQPKVFKEKNVQVAKTLPIEQKELKTPAVETKQQPIIQNSEFLLGRVCTKDIFNFNNELLIKAHGVVNKKNLKEINKFGKLRELMLYSK